MINITNIVVLQLTLDEVLDCKVHYIRGIVRIQGKIHVFISGNTKCNEGYLASS